MFKLQVFERTAAAIPPVRNGDIEHPVRGFRGSPGLDRPSEVLHREMGQAEQSAEGAHLLQSAGPAALPHPGGSVREAVARRRGDQHLRYKLMPNLRT